MEKHQSECESSRGAKRATLMRLFQCGVSAVKGDRAVAAWLSKGEIEPPTHILAVGKASIAMFEGLPGGWRNATPALLVTKTNHIGSSEFASNVAALEASHPVPDQSSLEAGRRSIDFVENCGAESRLLMLVSGGASSLVEHLKEGVGYDELVALTKSALGAGADIAEINRQRKEISAIKGGRLLERFGGSRVDVLAISDVRGDSIDVIGSGVGACSGSVVFGCERHIIASNAVAREAVVRAAESKGLQVISNKETMYADISEIAANIVKDLMAGPRGLYIYGGEPTVILPENPGLGGRNQALALEIARRIRDRTDICGIVAGTDGSDGPTNAAGAFVDGDSFLMEPGAEKALNDANCAPYLARTGDQIITGPTGTNVMDLAILIKDSGKLGS